MSEMVEKSLRNPRNRAWFGRLAFVSVAMMLSAATYVALYRTNLTKAASVVLSSYNNSFSAVSTVVKGCHTTTLTLLYIEFGSRLSGADPLVVVSMDLCGSNRVNEQG